MELLASPAEDVKRVAARALCRIAPNGQPHQQESTVVEVLTTPASHYAGFFALERLQTNTTAKRMAALLAGEDPKLRSRAAYWFSKANAPLVAANLPTIRKAMAEDLHPAHDFHTFLCRAVARLGTAGAPCRPELLRLIGTPTMEARQEGCKSLRAVGVAPEDVRALLPLLDRWETGEEAAKAIAMVGAGAVPHLRERLTKFESQRYAASVVIHLGEVAAPALPDLLAALRSPTTNPIARPNLIAAAGAIGPKAEPAVPLLLAYLKGGQAEDRIAAARALGAIGLPADVIVPALLRAFQDPDYQVWAAAAGAIARLKPDARVAVPILSGRIHDLDRKTSNGGSGEFTLTGIVRMGELAQEKEARLALVRAVGVLDVSGTLSGAFLLDRQLRRERDGQSPGRPDSDEATDPEGAEEKVVRTVLERLSVVKGSGEK